MNDWIDKLMYEIGVVDRDGTFTTGVDHFRRAINNARAGGMQYATTYLQTAYEAKEAGTELDMNILYDVLFTKISKLETMGTLGKTTEQIKAEKP